MKLNFKTLLKFLIPIFGLAALSGYYRYKYVLNPDGLRNSKGELYAEKYSYMLDDQKFIDKCLFFNQDRSDISYGEIDDPKFPNTEVNFKKQRVTLRGYGTLINSCRHDVVINGLSMQSQIKGRSWEGVLESSFYPNEYHPDINKEYDAINNLFFPNGNKLKGNSSIKIELATTDWFSEEAWDGNDIPKKGTPIKFKLKKSTINWMTYSIEQTKTLNLKELAEDGLAVFSISWKNPHGRRSIMFDANGCTVFAEETIKDGCKLKNWQLLNKETKKPILNSKDFALDQLK